MLPIAKDKGPGTLGTCSFPASLPELGPWNFHVEFIELETLITSKHRWSRTMLLTLASALLSANNILHFSLFLSLSCLSRKAPWGGPLWLLSSAPAWTVFCLSCSSVLCADALEQEERNAPTLPADLPFLGGGWLGLLYLTRLSSLPSSFDSFTPYVLQEAQACPRGLRLLTTGCNLAVQV